MYIQCNSISKSYGVGALEVQVLLDMTLQVQSGERLAIVGSSGSGKSTLMHLIGGLDLPDRGDITIAGKVINQLNETQRCLWRGHEVGFIYQFHHLLPEFTVLENVAMPLLIHRPKGTDVYQNACALLERVGLENRLAHKPHELSGGERQRVAICRALINKPGVILADEPTGNLDAETASLVINLMLETSIENNVTLVAVTHDQKLSRRFDRSFSLENGCLQKISHDTV